MSSYLAINRQDQASPITTPLRNSGIDFDEEDKRYTDEGDIGRRLKHVNPKTPLLLGKFSVVCIVANRMIGKFIRLRLTRFANVLWLKEAESS